MNKKELEQAIRLLNQTSEPKARSRLIQELALGALEHAQGHHDPVYMLRLIRAVKGVKSKDLKTLRDTGEAHSEGCSLVLWFEGNSNYQYTVAGKQDQFVHTGEKFPASVAGKWDDGFEAFKSARKRAREEAKRQEAKTLGGANANANANANTDTDTNAKLVFLSGVKHGKASMCLSNMSFEELLQLEQAVQLEFMRRADEAQRKAA